MNNRNISILISAMIFISLVPNIEGLPSDSRFNEYIARMSLFLTHIIE